MKPVLSLVALAALLLLATGAGSAGQVTAKDTTPEAARPPCEVGKEELLSPRARRAELSLLRARLALMREEELERLRAQLEARLRERERAIDAQDGNQAINLP